MTRNEGQPISKGDSHNAAWSVLHAGGAIAWHGVKSFFLTWGLVVAGGVVLAVLSFFFLRRDPWVGAVAAVVAIVESVALGAALAGKRGLFAAVAHGIREAGLARHAVSLVFDRLLGPSGGAATHRAMRQSPTTADATSAGMMSASTAGEVAGEHSAPGDSTSGGRAAALAQAVERLPLAQAEERLKHVVNGLLGDEVEGTGMIARARRGIRRAVLKRVEKYTLARFREEGAATGGVDLRKVRTELESRIDETLLGKLKGGVNLWTFAALVGLPLTVAVQTYVALAYLGR